ncbi:YdcF family protein [Clostridium sp. DL1XJH146]
MDRFISKLCIVIGIISLVYYIAINWMSFAKIWLVLGIVLIAIGILRIFGVELIIFQNRNIKILFTTVVTIVLASFLIFEGIIIHEGRQKEMSESDYVIVLGAGLRGNIILASLQYRLEKCVEYVEEYPNTTIIVSGGQGPDELVSEAAAMKEFLVNNGVDEEKIIMEDKSTSTMENLQFSKEKIIEDGGSTDSTISLITNGFHMYRAKFLAKRVGLEVSSMPAKSYLPAVPNFYVREYFAFVKSFIFDK